ncbi:MAG: riboflavin biosynthesis protein RibF [Christensenellaceae bacterium]|jgi:riboflavin kinase/FMN adenylyltransferase|nr:riboflavin biosynthesis protein RibF [Christensenellaceae bacterium]
MRKVESKMKHITDDDFAMRDTCVALGSFDGLHKGHRAVLDSLLATAKAKGLAPVLLSFDGDAAAEGPKRLTTEAEKRRLLANSGLFALVSFKACGLTYADILREVAAKALGAKAVVVGENDSNLGVLQELAGVCGYELITCGTATQDGAEITTARALDALCASDYKTLEALLGHPYFVYGRVEEGKHLGRTVGMPTANIGFAPNKQLPPDGVYGTITECDGKVYKGMANIGKRPTVDNYDYLTVENYILDFSQDIYGQYICMNVHTQIRGVAKFNSLEEVKKQVELDIQAARATLEESIKAYTA